MALLTEDNVRAAARQTHDRMYKSYNKVLEEVAETAEDNFDIFLSHSIKDAEIVRGTHVLLKRLGYSVYVDWIIDPELDRAEVSRATALHLKKRMSQCKALLYLSTQNSVGSKWMPWELGFFDGFSKGKVAILPVAKRARDDYVGQEYLSVYPYADVAAIEGTRKQTLWVNRSETYYGQFDVWRLIGQRAMSKHEPETLSVRLARQLLSIESGLR
jgi:hypothetical protein